VRVQEIKSVDYWNFILCVELPNKVTRARRVVFKERRTWGNKRRKGERELPNKETYLVSHCSDLREKIIKDEEKRQIVYFDRKQQCLWRWVERKTDYKWMEKKKKEHTLVSDQIFLVGTE